MEAKICICLGALLLFHLGAAEHDGEHAAHTVPQPDLDHHHTRPPNTIFETSSTSTTGRNFNVTTHLETSTVMPTANKENSTNIEATSVVSNPETGSNRTDVTAANPAVLTSIAPNTSASVPAHTAHTDAPTSASPLPSDLLPISIPPSSRTTSNSQTHSPTSATMMTLHTTTITQSTSSTSSASESPTSLLLLLQTSSGPHPEASSQAHLQTTSTQTRLQSGTPASLNVKGDTVIVPDAPTLDPLLAGLVSAFIVTAAIITLLLFLRFRQRDTRPEFRRLQDLPMDDMMEETPLSMYSY